MTISKVWPWVLAAILVIGGVLTMKFGPKLLQIVHMASAIEAKTLCSEIFVARRNQSDIQAEDLSEGAYWPLKIFALDVFRPRVDREAKTVTASLLGVGRETAIFRDGLGCTLLDGKKEEELRAQAIGKVSLPESNAESLWPEGEQVDLAATEPGFDRAKLDAAVQTAFAETDARDPNTRALIVVHRGRIVAEHYAPGFDKTTPLTGWSMGKSLTNALIGLRVLDGKMRVTDQALLPEWQKEDDPRRDITLTQLLCMTSGLRFQEDYNSFLSDVRLMLFIKGDKSGFASAQDPQYSPGVKWAYSSGTTNILTRILRGSFSREAEYLLFPRERLFLPLGMQSAVLEPDAAGVFVGSSFVYASARDWARLGLLYLQDGVWQGRRLLPEGWVADSVRTCEDSKGQYGWQFWLKLDESPPDLGEPPFPEDAFYMQGHDGQVVAIIPSLDLIIVRLGLTRTKGSWDHACDLAPILQAFLPGKSGCQADGDRNNPSFIHLFLSPQ